jgi:predicted SnoaL-like aldol condensation-catalyzing enzyme
MSEDELNAARIRTVRAHMALECTHEWDGVIATFEHPRYELHATGAVYDGEDQVRGYFASSRAAFPDQSNEVIAIAATGDTVLVEFWLMGTHLGPFTVAGKTYPPTGRKFRTRIAASFEFAPGTDKIICERPYSSSDAKLRALDLV